MVTYRTSKFKIIPSELESLGKKVCVDDHGSVFTIGVKYILKIIKNPVKVI